jgi:signal recognition particle receptor subunit beta
LRDHLIRHLHNVLAAFASLPPSQVPPTLAVLAHKSDLLKTGSSSSAADASQLAINRVRTTLERELEKRRLAQSGSVGMESLGDDEASSESAGLGGLECVGGGQFKFAEWEGGQIDFVASHVKLWERLDVGDEKTGGGQGVQMLIDWINSLS